MKPLLSERGSVTRSKLPGPDSFASISAILSSSVSCFRFCAATLILCSFVTGCSTPKHTAEVFRPDKLAAMDAAINQAISSNKCPGGVLWFEHNGTSYHKAFGNRALVPQQETMTENTIFDAASLTKVAACTPAVMILVDRGAIRLDAPIHTYIPEFKGEAKERVTVRMLLNHTSGLRPDVETKSDWRGQVEAVRKACEDEKIQTNPGTAFKYSDINFFLLGEIVQRVSQTPLEVFVQREIYEPLKMHDTGYLPPHAKLSRIAPTEAENGNPPWRGVVHDPTARKMGGVAGHAGLFTTASDLARYARMLVNLGELDGVRIFKPATVQLMTSVQTPPEITVRRGLGWDIDSSYSGPRGDKFPLGSYGHTGWTGGSLWIDPFSKSFVIFLSNRNHPSGGNVSGVRHELGTLAADAITDFDFSNVPGALAPRTNSASSRQ